MTIKERLLEALRAAIYPVGAFAAPAEHDCEADDEDREEMLHELALKNDVLLRDVRVWKQRAEDANKGRDAWQRRWGLLRKQVAKYPGGMRADDVENVLANDDLRGAGVSQVIEVAAPEVGLKHGDLVSVDSLGRIVKAVRQ